MKIPKSLASCVVILAALFPPGSASSMPISPAFHSATPAGYEVVMIKPAGAEVSLLGLIECPELEGTQHVAEGINAKVIAADGKQVTEFPRNFSFRITASLRKTVMASPSGDVNSPEAPQDFLLKLKFNLKAYDGLKVRDIEPESVQMIGVPADVPYDERVYRITFNVDNLPARNRLVLEVLSPEGERLGRFHFDLL